MTFQDINNIIKPTYSSENEDIVESFYNPILSEAKRYDRISGYFDSTSLAIAAEGMKNFIYNKGYMRLLCGAQLNPKDVESIKDASDIEKLISTKFLEDLNNIEDELVNNHIKVLGWMIANNILEIKIGINQKNGEYIGGGILHSKTGILWDNKTSCGIEDLKHCIIFNGSNNETAAGWKYNIETFNVFKGGEDDKFMIEYINDFPQLWNGEHENLIVMDIPEADKNELIKRAPSSIEELNKIVLNKTYHKDKKNRILFNHQKDAINSWFKNNNKGIFEMATGTGKTYTSLNCFKKLYEKNDKLITVIACPYSHLIEQWKKEIESFNFDNIKLIFGGNSNWKKDLNRIVRHIKRNKLKKTIILTTHKTMSKDFFIEKINEINADLLLIADEMHHLASENYSKGLIDNYNYRLGLSATPSKFMDEEATENLIKYFGGVIYKFTLSDALHQKNPITHQTYLTPYKYYPEKIDLNAVELKEYAYLTQKIAVNINNIDNAKNKENLNSLFRKRRSILNNAEGKYRKLHEILQKNPDINHLIIFCSPQQIENVLKILKEENITPRHKFTSKEKTNKDKNLGGMSERQYLLTEFDKGNIKALVAMKCLDEGVDVPSTCNVIIMSSTTNPREYIQRRGRVLRRCQGKEFAYIYDMMVAPESDESFVDNIINKELNRLKDFILTANNQKQCQELLRKWRLI
ncbi:MULTISPECIES: DEAD/DEAH box helicase family protein [unclassified Methanobrevibacter]|jgi:superfamily II DNA or RNA helicase|uniref:DEAD/DEAH box helicase family protein n=1 Tax=unclassified Methanobrevibacter TaxID=2638681 RepID=UPI0039B8D76C